MRRTIAVAVCALVLSTSTIAAQVGSMRVTVPSPTAASLGKFGDVPVALYTGVPSISIPLFTAKGKTLELPIALSYHAGGIRVEEIGGWAGIGWALEAGGSITRTVRGIVDEYPAGYYNTGTTWYSTANWPVPNQTSLDNIAQELLDGEPDQFFFNVGGRSGEIVMGPIDAAGTIEYQTIPHQEWRITPSFGGPNGDITGWDITTEDGTRYSFYAVETNTDYSLPSNGQIPLHYGRSFTSAWHLSTITAPGGDHIDFGYTPYTIRHRLSPYFEKFDQVSYTGEMPCRPAQYGTINDYQIDGLRLAGVTTAAHAIAFYAGLRDDALSPEGNPQEPRLDSMTVMTTGGLVLRVFKFEHDYSTGRLTLTNVYERDINGVSLPPYSLTYSGPTLPALTSYSLDHWGFYNGKTNPYTPVPMEVTLWGGVLPGADRNPDSTFMVAGALTKITYPTGGYNEFVYEPNDYGGIDFPAIMPVGYGPEQTRHVTTWDAPSASFTVVGINSNDHVLVSIYVNQDPSGCGGQIYPPCPYTNVVDQNQQNVVGWTDNGTFYFTLVPGTYTLQTTDNGGYPDAWALATLTWRDHIPMPKKLASGLRIAELRTFEPASNQTTIRKYKYTLQSDPNRSSGMVTGEPSYAYQFSSPTCSFFSRSSMSRVPLGGGPVVGYREVTVWHGANGEFGKTRHTFRSVTDVADGPQLDDWPSLRRTNLEWMRGQESSATEYNSSAQIQQQVASSYGFPNVKRFQAVSVYFLSAGTGGFFNQSFGVWYTNPVEVFSSRVQQLSQATTAYDEAGANSFATTRTYTYGNPVHGQLTELIETNSDGTQRVTRMKYPDDYGVGSGNPEAAALTAMRGSAHMPGVVIERSVSVRVGASEKVVQAEITTFKEFAAGQFLPFKHYVFNNPVPLP